jgi:hypothetical protein
MDTIRLSDDGSKPARRRDPNNSPFAHDTPTTPRKDRDQRTPPVDWTGQRYKSPADALAAGIDYDHVGRTSSAAERLYFNAPTDRVHRNPPTDQ